MQIKNKQYRAFLATGEIHTINEEDIKTVINNLESKHKQQATSLIILLYYTGCRPNEALKIKAKDIIKNGRYYTIKIQGSKKGLPRIVYLPINDLTKTLYNYASTAHPEQNLFYSFISKSTRQKTTVTLKNGQKKTYIKEYARTSNKLTYHFKKWLSCVIPEGIPPYYLRHNRFSKLAMNGVSMNQMRLIKGSRTFESITPYLHLSADEAKKAARKIQ